MILLLALLQGVIAQPDNGLAALSAKVDNAQATADAASAAIPPKCTTTPASDTYGGKVGTQAVCTPPADASRATQVQATTATTAADGSFSGTFPVSFVSVPSYAHAEVNSATTPYVCQMTTITMTTFVGKCFQVVSTTLGTALTNILNAVINPITAATAGETVKVIARQ